MTLVNRSLIDNQSESTLGSVRRADSRSLLVQIHSVGFPGFISYEFSYYKLCRLGI